MPSVSTTHPLVRPSSHRSLQHALPPKPERALCLRLRTYYIVLRAIDENGPNGVQGAAAAEFSGPARAGGAGGSFHRLRQGQQQAHRWNGGMYARSLSARLPPSQDRARAQAVAHAILASCRLSAAHTVGRLVLAGDTPRFRKCLRRTSTTSALWKVPLIQDQAELKHGLPAPPLCRCLWWLFSIDVDIVPCSLCTSSSGWDAKREPRTWPRPSGNASGPTTRRSASGGDWRTASSSRQRQRQETRRCTGEGDCNSMWHAQRCSEFYCYVQQRRAEGKRVDSRGKKVPAVVKRSEGLVFCYVAATDSRGSGGRASELYGQQTRSRYGWRTLRALMMSPPNCSGERADPSLIVVAVRYFLYRRWCGPA